MERERAMRELLRRFAQPTATSRTGNGENPEDDTMTLEVKAGDWLRACVAVGNMDADYLRALPANARPSETFIDSLAALAPSPEAGE